MSSARPHAQDSNATTSIPESFDRRHASHTRPYTIWDAPQAVKHVFSKFPLYTAASEPRPAHLNRLEKVQRGRKVQFWSNTLSEDPRALSYNVNCLKYQALLLANGIPFEVVRTVSDGSPDGRLPFLLTTNANKQVNIVHSGQVEKFIRDQVGTEEKESQRNKEAEGLGLLDKDIRAAWLYACYLTPSNFRSVVFKLYVASVTHAPLSHYAMLDRIYADARDEFSKLEYTPDLGRSSWRGTPPPGHLDLAQSLNRRAGLALDHLIELLDGQTFFSGTDKPGVLDVALFAYTRLLTQHDFAEGIAWADWGLEQQFSSPMRKAIPQHAHAVYEYCFKGRRDFATYESKRSEDSFTDVQAQSMYQESQTSFSEINESQYQDSQHSYEEIGESSYQPENQDSYAEIGNSQSTSAVEVQDDPEPDHEPAPEPETEPETTSLSEQEPVADDHDGSAMSSSHLFA